MNSKYHREHQRNCNYSITFTYLMTSKLIYLHMDYKISDQIVHNALFLYPLKISENLTLCFQAFEKGYIGNEWVNQLPEFEKVRDLFSTPSNIFYETFSKTFINVKLKPLTNVSSSSCNTNGDILLTASILLGITLINHFHLKYWSVDCLNISRTLK